MSESARTDKSSTTGMPPVEAAELEKPQQPPQQQPRDSGEDGLRNQLRSAVQQLKRREPLDPKYKKLLLGGIVTNRRPVLPKSHSYRKIGSNLRTRVEKFMEQTQGKDPFDRILARQPLQEDQMRAALTLREHKKHEQKVLLDATMAALPRRNGMDAMTRRRHLEGIALGLVQTVTERNTNRMNKTAAAATNKIGTSSNHKSSGPVNSELERQKAQVRAREEARNRRDEEERRKQLEDDMKRKKKAETPQQALYKLYHPIFKRLWEMEFPHLNNTNPFRIVIDKDTCASLGAPDYFDVIETPMNLAYIQTKVDNMEYESLRSFFADIDLMIQNALKYNSDLSNPYRVAAEEMKRRYKKIAKKVIQTYQAKQQQAKAQAQQQK